MSEHLRYLAAHSPAAAVLHAQRRAARAHRRRRLLPGDARRAGRRARGVRHGVRALAGRRLLRHHARAHRRAGRAAGDGAAGCARAQPAARARRGLAVPARAVPAGHRVPGDRRADQRQRLQGVPRGACSPATTRTAWRSPAAQTRDGAHLLDVCVDYVGRDGAADMREIAGRLATAATLPLVLDSTEPAVHRGRAGAARRPRRGQLGELRGRRRARTRGSPG